MKEGTSITDHVDEYNKVILDLQSIDIKIEDEEKTLLLLCSLPPSYEHLGITLLYGNDIISTEEVETVINSQELRKKVSENRREEHGDVSISSSDEGWILNTSFSYHMCPNRDWFVIYRSFDGGKVLMENDVACKMVVIDSIQIRMHYGIVRNLIDVRYVPELRKNLISLGTLDSNGCSYRATGGVMRIMKGALVVMKGLKQNSLYLL
ncbi:hypothetical protein RJ639_039150 [Escallonia herrerae]|uniref:Retrovirus-related Pol polyprotein from transposon TNT 1-94-like beta-barrel domain-containing protein n=1 Tax=Escallonia herrerae TaxID=1293975 RepID=A0AA89B721_9ASTE|nr:hypothetical protein RJ639_039150 [Escallonia herrerae]